jgi:hypothetical protein
MKLSWTVADVMRLNPCLKEAVVRSHFGLNDTLTIGQILNLPTLSDEHKVWMACRTDALTPEVVLLWREVVLTRVITKFALPESSTHEWATNWLSGQDRSAARAAWAAGAAGAARAAEAAWAAEAAEAARAAGAAWAAGAAGAAWAAWVAGAARDAGAAEYTQQIVELKALIVNAGFIGR